MIQPVLNYNHTRLNVSKAVLRSVLNKTHHEKLIVAGHQRRPALLHPRRDLHSSYFLR